MRHIRLVGSRDVRMWKILTINFSHWKQLGTVREVTIMKAKKYTRFVRNVLFTSDNFPHILRWVCKLSEVKMSESYYFINFSYKLLFSFLERSKIRPNEPTVTLIKVFDIISRISNQIYRNFSLIFSKSITIYRKYWWIMVRYFKFALRTQQTHEHRSSPTRPYYTSPDPAWSPANKMAHV